MTASNLNDGSVNTNESTTSSVSFNYDSGPRYTRVFNAGDLSTEIRDMTSTFAFSGGAAVDINVSTGDTIESASLLTQEGSQRAMTILRTSVQRLADIRGQIGAFQNRLNVTASQQLTASLHLEKSTSNLQDADYAEVASDQARAQIRQSLLDKVAPLQNVDAERAKRLIEMIG